MEIVTNGCVTPPVREQLAVFDAKYEEKYMEDKYGGKVHDAKYEEQYEEKYQIWPSMEENSATIESRNGSFQLEQMRKDAFGTICETYTFSNAPYISADAAWSPTKPILPFTGDKTDDLILPERTAGLAGKVWSVGSRFHGGSGSCTPCRFFVSKQGCAYGVACESCHMHAKRHRPGKSKRVQCQRAASALDNVPTGEAFDQRVAELSKASGYMRSIISSKLRNMPEEPINAEKGFVLPGTPPGLDEPDLRKLIADSSRAVELRMSF